MKLARSTNRQRHLGAPMTPMIDVVFLLLIFFVCTADFNLAEPVLPATLSAVETSGDADSAVAPGIQPEMLVVRVTPAPQPVVVDDRRCSTAADLTAALHEAAAANARRVVLNVDHAARLDRVVDVYDECHLAGFRRIQFAVRRP